MLQETALRPAAPTWSKPVVAALNRHKRLLQWGLAVLGLLFVAVAFQNTPVATTGGFLDRALKRGFNAVAKPTEILIWLVAGLYAVRISFRYQHPFKEAARAGLRLLQIVHIPLAMVLLAASAVHGYLYAWYLWRSDFHYWSGIAALSAMAAVSLLGLGAIKGRKYRAVHLVTGLVATGLVVVHIFL